MDAPLKRRSPKFGTSFANGFETPLVSEHSKSVRSGTARLPGRIMQCAQKKIETLYVIQLPKRPYGPRSGKSFRIIRCHVTQRGNGLFRTKIPERSCRS